mgnify:FL=1
MWRIRKVIGVFTLQSIKSRIETQKDKKQQVY